MQLGNRCKLCSVSCMHNGRVLGGRVVLCIQAETIKKREAEYFKLQRDLEDVQTQNEIHLGSFRKKQQDQINQLTEQLDQQYKARQK